MTDGLVVVDKPSGWTSHDVVARCRKIYGQKKIGHSGTLDPDATGLLLVGLGRVTRLLRFLTELPKTYATEIVFGRATSTLDSSGDTTGEWAMDGLAPDAVEAAAKAFVGDIEQVPPMVSAVKVGGRRLHELAREGKEVERLARPVTVHRFELSATHHPLVYRALVECSSGTYIRTLGADLGQALGGGAHIRDLRRTAIGSFSVADAVALEDVGADDVLPAAEALRDYPAVVVVDEVEAAVRHGKVLRADEMGAPAVTTGAAWRVLDAEGDLLAVYEHHREGTVKPAVVLRPAAT